MLVMKRRPGDRIELVRVGDESDGDVGLMGFEPDEHGFTTGMRFINLMNHERLNRGDDWAMCPQCTRFVKFIDLETHFFPCRAAGSPVVHGTQGTDAN